MNTPSGRPILTDSLTIRRGRVRYIARWNPRRQLVTVTREDAEDRSEVLGSRVIPGDPRAELSATVLFEILCDLVPELGSAPWATRPAILEETR